MSRHKLPDGARHTLETIAERCIEEGDCLLWQGATTGHGTPAIKVKGKTVSLRFHIFKKLLRRPLPPGHLVSHKCGDPLCVAPKHIKAMDRTEMAMRAIERTGYTTRADWLAKCTAAGMLNAKNDPEMVERVLNADGSNRKIARDTGLSRDVVDRIRSMRTWSPNNPFNGLGARRAANDSTERKRA